MCRSYLLTAKSLGIQNIRLSTLQKRKFLKTGSNILYLYYNLCKQSLHTALFSIQSWPVKETYLNQ